MKVRNFTRVLLIKGFFFVYINVHSYIIINLEFIVQFTLIHTHIHTEPSCNVVA